MNFFTLRDRFVVLIRVVGFLGLAATAIVTLITSGLNDGASWRFLAEITGAIAIVALPSPWTDRENRLKSYYSAAAGVMIWFMIYVSLQLFSRIGEENYPWQFAGPVAAMMGLGTYVILVVFYLLEMKLAPRFVWTALVPLLLVVLSVLAFAHGNELIAQAQSFQERDLAEGYTGVGGALMIVIFLVVWGILKEIRESGFRKGFEACRRGEQSVNVPEFRDRR